MVSEDGEQFGIMTVGEAVHLAHDQNRDLIEIVPNADPPVCKLIDFGKFKYEIAKREKIQKKHQHTAQVKEIRFHPNTDTHDFDFKSRHARAFLEDGQKVKATVVFKGREITYQNQGKELLDRLIERLADVSKIDQEAKMEGKAMILMLAPDKSKKKTKPGSTTSTPTGVN